jgi:hypothetical protein
VPGGKICVPFLNETSPTGSKVICMDQLWVVVGELQHYCIILFTFP